MGRKGLHKMFRVCKRQKEALVIDEAPGQLSIWPNGVEAVDSGFVG